MAAPNDASTEAMAPSSADDAAAFPKHSARTAALARWVPVEIALVALVALAAGRVLHRANADALLPSLMSTQRLTWFYWGQDRLANVVPVLAVPVQDVRWNLSIQLFLVGLGWFALAALFAANHFARRGHRVNPLHVAVVTLAAGGATWILVPPRTEHVLVFEQLYAFALTLFLLGLLGASNADWRWRVLGALAIGASTLVNPSLLLYAPFVVFLPGLHSIRTRAKVPVPTPQLLVPLALAVLAFVMTSVASNAFGHEPHMDTGYSEFSVTRMRHNFADAYSNVADSVRGNAALIVLPVAALLLAARARSIGWRLGATYLSAPLFAIVWTFVFSGNTWVGKNQWVPRYFFPVYAAGLLLVVAAIAEAVQIISRSGRTAAWHVLASRWHRSTVPVGLILAIAAPVAGVALLRTVDLDELERAEAHVEAVQKYDVDLVAGAYWTAWPAVIAARARNLDVLGVSERSVAIQSHLADRIQGDLAAGDRIVVLCTDIDESACAAAVAEWAPLELRVEHTISSSPLVIELGPAG